MGKVEDEYFDVLQNIELVIVAMYRYNPDMTDYHVMHMLEALIDGYKGEKIGRPPRDFRLTEFEQELLKAVRSMCEWRLGRAPFPGEAPDSEEGKPEPKTVDEILLCLKRIRRSVKRWNKCEGRQGYLDFVNDFVP